MDSYAYLENFTGSHLNVLINGVLRILPTSYFYNPAPLRIYPGDRMVIIDEGLYRICGYYGLAFINPFTDQLRRQDTNYTIPNFVNRPLVNVYFIIYSQTETALGGLDDGPIKYIDSMTTRSITYRDDEVYSLSSIGPTMFSMQTYETDVPITLNLSPGPLINIITVTGRSSDSSFHASFLVLLQETGDMGIEEISSYSIGPVTVEADIHDSMIFLIRTSEERKWKIHVRAH